MSNSLQKVPHAFFSQGHHLQARGDLDINWGMWVAQTSAPRTTKNYPVQTMGVQLMNESELQREMQVLSAEIQATRDAIQARRNALRNLP